MAFVYPSLDNQKPCEGVAVIGVVQCAARGDCASVLRETTATDLPSSRNCDTLFPFVQLLTRTPEDLFVSGDTIQDLFCGTLTIAPNGFCPCQQLVVSSRKIGSGTPIASYKRELLQAEVGGDCYDECRNVRPSNH